MARRKDSYKLKLLQLHNLEIECWTESPFLALALEGVERHGRQVFDIRVGDTRILGTCELNTSVVEDKK